MTEPWFDVNAFGAWFGTVAGGGGGSLIGLWGALTGWLAPQGRARGLIYGLWVLFAVFAAASLVFGRKGSGACSATGRQCPSSPRSFSIAFSSSRSRTSR